MKYIVDTTYLIDLINGDQGAVELAKELDRDGELVWFSVILVEKYLRGIYYLYLDDESKLKKKLRGVMRDLSPFEIIPITYEIF